MFDIIQSLYYAAGFCAVISLIVFFVKKRGTYGRNGNKWNHTRHYGAVDRYLKTKKKKK